MLALLDSVPQAASSAQPSSIYLWVGLVVAAAAFIYFFRRTNKILDNGSIPAQASTGDESEEDNAAAHELNEEAAAAIATALHLYKRDLHDKESFTITMQKVSRIYSPWSSKIYTLRQIPNRK